MAGRLDIEDGNMDNPAEAQVPARFGCYPASERRWTDLRIPKSKGSEQGRFAWWSCA